MMIRLPLVACCLAILFPPAATFAQVAEKPVYYWVSASHARPNQPNESFVIVVTREQARQIETIRRNGGQPGFSGEVAVGSVDYNKDYFAPDHRGWNWHISAVNEIFDFNSSVFPTCECPYLVANPSDIEAGLQQWIEENRGNYTPLYYLIREKVVPSQADRLANVSNRGLTGAGEKTLITGLIITGGEPRNVVVRVLGPSLAPKGVQQAAANPKLVVYRGAEQIASNADWQTDPRANALASSYSALVPENSKEAALLLTLQPGAYTLHGLNEDGSDGIVLIEAYDVDASSSSGTAPAASKK